MGRAIMNTILVAVDLSHKDEILIQRASKLATMSNATIHLLHVRRTLRALGIDQSERKRHESLLFKINELAKNNISAPDVKIQTHFAEGAHVFEQIHRYAQYLNAELLIMGASERKGETPAFVRTTLEKLLLNAEYPVLVCSNHHKNQYENVALDIHAKTNPSQSINILSSMLNDKLTLHYYSKAYAHTHSNFLLRLRSKMRKRQAEKLKRDMITLLETHGILQENIYLIQHDTRAFLCTNEDVERIRADILVKHSLRKELNTTSPASNIRQLLGRPPCDLLLMGKA
ncbi:MAG: hypothetical protein CMH32_06280 [Micavibrio sp.]|nr:hypothetical protein [Micavibrio sp.]